MRICEWSSDVCSSDLDAPVLALLPGSRLGEISRLGAPFLAAAAKVAGETPGLQAVIPAANAACRQALESLLSESPALDPRPLLLDGQARTAMVAADVVLLASGTATLEAMLAKRPMVVGYRIAPLTPAIVKGMRSEEHTSELRSLMRTSYAVFCLQ